MKIVLNNLLLLIIEFLNKKAIEIYSWDQFQVLFLIKVKGAFTGEATRNKSGSNVRWLTKVT